MIIGPLEILKTLFNVDEIVHFRIIDDKKAGIFMGAKIAVKLDEYSTIEQQLKDHNARNRGIFFVVNFGGDLDKDITRINAQFVEMDDATFAEQWEKVQKFPIDPSFVIQTQKSLHVYWLIKDGDVALFRAIQKGLVKHFQGDPACVNESRCMRLPGFNHCKKDTPVMVECQRFNPQLRYTQDEIIAALGDDYTPDATVNNQQSTQPTGTEMGLDLVVNTCEFIKHCNTNAATLSEPMWYAEVTNLAPFEGGRDAIHLYSAPYPGYDKAKTDAKIDHFLSSGTGPMTCEKIKEMGYDCPKMVNGECSCKAPAAKSYQALGVDEIKALLSTQPVKGTAVEDMQTAQKFMASYMFNLDTATAETLMKYDIKDHFKFKVGDLKPLFDAFKQKAKDFQAQKAKRAQEKQMGKLPPWYAMSDKGPKFMPDVLADHCAKNKAVFCICEEFYLYNNGVYRPLSDERAKNMIREEMLMGYTKLSQINDATAQWRMQIQQDAKDLNTNPFLINLRNGMYNVLDDKLIDHDAKYLTTVQLSVGFTPGADCPRFKRFLDEQLEADQIPLVQEWMGYVMIPTNRAQKSLVFVGEAAAGKSVLLRVINEVLLGRENTSNVSWQALNERFKPAELFGKLANIFADLPTKNIDDNGMYKSLVGEDSVTVERKNQHPFSFQSFSRLLFSCNTIPRNYGDKSEGFYRRLCIIRFTRSVPKDKRDPELVDKFRAEADGIFLFALEGLKRLMNNGFVFSETQRNVDELEKYREDSNSVLAFVKERCVLELSAEEGRTIVYDTYKSYCDECGLQPYSQRKFNEELETHYPQIRRAKDPTGKRKTWRGLKLDDQSD